MPTSKVKSSVQYTHHSHQATKSTCMVLCWVHFHCREAEYISLPWNCENTNHIIIVIMLKSNFERYF